MEITNCPVYDNCKHYAMKGIIICNSSIPELDIFENIAVNLPNAFKFTGIINYCGSTTLQSEINVYENPEPNMANYEFHINNNFMLYIVIRDSGYDILGADILRCETIYEVYNHLDKYCPELRREINMQKMVILE